jgi:hypothetical protein
MPPDFKNQQRDPSQILRTCDLEGMATLESYIEEMKRSGVVKCDAFTLTQRRMVAVEMTFESGVCEVPFGAGRISLEPPEGPATVRPGKREEQCSK